MAYSLCAAIAIGQEQAFEGGWKKNASTSTVFEINGTDSRNNPLRRKLAEPLSDDEVFVRFRLRYEADSIDTPLTDEGEFFVFWLDEAEGDDRSTHSGGVPNIGVHVSGDTNRFMVRYAPQKEAHAAELVGDREFQVVARLWKSTSGESQPYDQLNLWLDPASDAEFKPHASVSSSTAIAKVAWIGFSTGQKTEFEDRIFVRDISLASSWREILNLPPLQPGDVPPPMKKTIVFAEHVYPILQSKCFSCHQGDDADIRLDNADDVLNLCSLGRADESRLFDMISGGEMPPEDEPQLTKAEVETLRKWIDEGLDWNHELLPLPIPQTDHWAFQKIVRPEIPVVKNTDWVRTPVDAFIAHRHEQLGLSPAPAATPETLARRMSLDLLGLPPQEERGVDALLADPAYGERWGRHWLDVARWAESNGHQHNRLRPHAWRYRDWVVKAFNSDLPYDRFLTAQIAGDELPADYLPDDGALIATGFLAAARYSGNELDKRIQRNDILVDVANTSANAFLGLTFQCAQCHTHKFDPISIRDYYRLQAFFAKGQPGNVALNAPNESGRAAVKERWEIFDQTYERQVAIRRRSGHPAAELVLPKTVVQKMSTSDRKRFNELEAEIAAFDQTWGFFAPSTAATRRIVTPHEMRWPLERDPHSLATRETHILLRGDVNARGPVVQPGWPRVFGETGELGDQPRTALAAWMTDRNNPLVARVWVNRIWYWHFGRGLVETVEDLGKQGTPPTHAGLLDFLASELMTHNWSTKHIHRLILNSNTYRQSSRFSSANSEIDPDNSAYWRWTPRRLEAEAIRDSMLSASGLLDSKSGGPSDAVDGESHRRSIYLKQQRDRLAEQQTLFDSASGVASCSRRRVSTNSLQPLWLLNSEFSRKTSAALAKRAKSVDEAFRICFGREPSEGELALLQTHAKEHGLESACLVLFNSSEFLYLT